MYDARKITKYSQENVDPKVTVGVEHVRKKTKSVYAGEKSRFLQADELA